MPFTEGNSPPSAMQSALPVRHAVDRLAQRQDRVGRAVAVVQPDQLAVVGLRRETAVEPVAALAVRRAEHRVALHLKVGDVGKVRTLPRQNGTRLERQGRAGGRIDLTDARLRLAVDRLEPPADQHSALRRDGQREHLVVIGLRRPRQVRAVGRPDRGEPGARLAVDIEEVAAEVDGVVGRGDRADLVGHHRLERVHQLAGLGVERRQPRVRLAVHRGELAAHIDPLAVRRGHHPQPLPVQLVVEGGDQVAGAEAERQQVLPRHLLLVARLGARRTRLGETAGRIHRVAHGRHAPHHAVHLPGRQRVRAHRRGRPGRRSGVGDRGPGRNERRTQQGGPSGERDAGALHPAGGRYRPRNTRISVDDDLQK
ncbi:hypothetical protein [Actinomadura gamaensis]|uniref:Uncharacterized protein n=1 Tax=Actinomadura gamaensis TaxID=1763541 RepID=A0ABV9U0Y1_9ACTN